MWRRSRCSGRYFPRSNESTDQPNEPSPTARINPDQSPTTSNHFRSLRSMLRPWMLRRGSKKVFDMSKTFFDPLRINRRVRSTRNQCPILPIEPEQYPDHQNGSGKCFEGCIFLDLGLDREPDCICVRGALLQVCNS